MRILIDNLEPGYYRHKFDNTYKHENAIEDIAFILESLGDYKRLLINMSRNMPFYKKDVIDVKVKRIDDIRKKYDDLFDFIHKSSHDTL